jgi:hypothetical protein
MKKQTGVAAQPDDCEEYDLASLPHELLGLQVEQLELEVDQVPDLVVAD